ncbi:MAG: hypothetical protein JZU59_15240, partial [Chromatium okenii]|nr:hypothetical protein [Chromatium okenii]
MTTAELTPTAAPAPESVPKTAPAPPSPPARRLKRWRWSAQLLLTLSGRLTLALLLLLCVTQTGLRLLCAGAEALLPVQITAAEGRLFGDWQLRGVTVTLPAVTLHFGAMAMDWSLLTLVNGTLTINNLVLDDVAVTLPPSADDAAPLQLPQLRLPFQLAVTQAIVNGLQISTAGAITPPLRINQLLLAATWHEHQLDIRNLTAQLPEPALTASISGQLALTADYPLALNVDWSLTTAPAVQWHGHAHGNGDLRQLQLTLNTSGAVTATFNGQVRELLTAPAWDGALTLAAVDVTTFAPTLPPLTVHGRFTTRGTVATASLSGELQLQQAETGAAAIALDLGWQDGILTLRQVQIIEQQSNSPTAPAPLVLHLTGLVDVSGVAPQLQLHGDWQALRWPLRGSSPVHSPQGQITVSGTPTALEYQLTATTAGAELPPA